MNKQLMALLLVAACAEKREAGAPAQTKADQAPRSQPVVASPAPEAPAEAKKEESKTEIAADRPQNIPAGPVRVGVLGPAAQEEAAAPSRSWFPETFLFEPLVVTDEQGAATVSVRVPDRLTTWRVLALAHSRAGAQAGTVASFLGTLDTYVDPVVPAFLLAGDEVRLPVQVVNTTAAPVAAELHFLVDNARINPTRAAVTIPARGSAVVYATIKPERAGTVTLRATLGQADAVVRNFPVLPAGRPVTTSRGGTLAAPRTLALEVPAAADPASSEVRVLVYPGALGILRAELAGSLARGGVADDAYTLYLAGNAGRLLGAFADKADPDVVRELTIVAGQRTARHARTLDVAGASLVAAAALAHADNPVLDRLGERAVATLAKLQRPDGTFGGGDGWTLQQLLVATADGVRAVQAAAARPEHRQRALAVALRAQGAIERNLERVEDGYTAAALVASGAVNGELADRLRAKVRDGIVARDDGSRVLAVPAGVVRADGRPPSEVEATALAVLALAGGGDAELLADLGTAVLSGYGRRGWGDGRANLVCLEAVLKLFSQPVPSGVKVALILDGKPVADGVLERERLREVLTLAAPAPPGRHQWQITATPPVPGLAYSLTQVSYVPWDKPVARGGVELAVALPADLRVGRPADLVVRAAAPAGRELRIALGLPAGVQVDSGTADKLVAAGALASWHAVDGGVELVAPALEPGATLSVNCRVIPTLAGTLRSQASTLHVAGESFQVPPAVWTVR